MAPRTALALILVTSVAIGATASAQLISRGGRPFHTELTGAVEIPPGDPDGSGTMQMTVNPGQGKLCYTLEVQGIVPTFAAHIHVGAAGTAPPGNIVVPLQNPGDGDATGCATITRELAQKIIRNPENYYVNVHNTPFPAGALRGQFSRAD